MTWNAAPASIGPSPHNGSLSSQEEVGSRVKRIGPRRIFGAGIGKTRKLARLPHLVVAQWSAGMKDLRTRKPVKIPKLEGVLVRCFGSAMFSPKALPR